MPLEAVEHTGVVPTFDTVHSLLPAKAQRASKSCHFRKPGPQLSGRARRKTILVASCDPAVTKTRRQVLEAAGYRVIAVRSVNQFARRCERHKFDLVVIGSSIPPAEKRKFWAESRINSHTPILELFSAGAPELMDESHSVQRSSISTDFFNSAGDFDGIERSANAAHPRHSLPLKASGKRTSTSTRVLFFSR